MAEQNGRNGNANGSGSGSGSTVESILKVLMEQLHSISKAETVAGQPMKAGDTTIIPVSKVIIGFAAGGSDAGGSNEARKSAVSIGGTGGGISVEPVAFIVVGPDGKAQLMPLKGTINQLSRVIDLVPDAIAKLAALRSGGAKDPAAALAAGEPAHDRKRKPGADE